MQEASPPSLAPIVTGRLASTELNIIESVKADTAYRLTISLDPAIALAAVRAAAAEKRDFSNYIEVALCDHCQQYAPPAPELAEFIAKLTAAYAASPRVLARCQSVVLKELRARKEAA